MLRKFLRDESGVTAMEYGLIAALIGVLLIVAVEFLSSSMTGMYNLISNRVDGAM
jgi:pilus assembly protein Flp/PilA